LIFRITGKNLLLYSYHPLFCQKNYLGLSLWLRILIMAFVTNLQKKVTVKKTAFTIRDFDVTSALSVLLFRISSRGRTPVFYGKWKGRRGPVCAYGGRQLSSEELAICECSMGWISW
jgi:hypothetical protein